MLVRSPTVGLLHSIRYFEHVDVRTTSNSQPADCVLGLGVRVVQHQELPTHFIRHLDAATVRQNAVDDELTVNWVVVAQPQDEFVATVESRCNLARVVGLGLSSHIYNIDPWVYNSYANA